MEHEKSIHLKRKESNEREKESRIHQEKRDKSIGSNVILENIYWRKRRLEESVSHE
jgi:hypothetical protein